MRSEQKVWSKERWETTSKGEPLAEADLVLYFGAPSALDDGRRWEDLRAQYPGARIVGCTTGGEILGNEVLDDTVVVIAVKFDSSSVAARSVVVAEAGESLAKGRELASGFAKEGLRALFVLSDGTRVNGTALVAGIREVVGGDVVITGGLAGDGANFKRTLVGADERPVEGGVAAVAFYGDRLHVNYGTAGGWTAFGPNRRITKATSNVLYELDGTPALTLYKRYLGDAVALLPSSALLFPLRIERSPDEKPLVRAVLAVDEATQSMTFAGDMPEGARAMFMRGTFEDLVQGAETAAEQSSCNGTFEDGGISILVSCIGRKLLMGQRIDDEVEAASDMLGPGVAKIGFYSYGEIAPIEGGFSDLHNETMTVTTFREV